MLILFWGHVAKRYDRDAVEALPAPLDTASTQSAFNRTVLNDGHLEVGAVRYVAFERTVNTLAQVPVDVIAVYTFTYARAATAHVEPHALAQRQVDTSRTAQDAVVTDVRLIPLKTVERQVGGFVSTDLTVSRTVSSARVTAVQTAPEALLERAVAAARTAALKVEILVVNRSRRYRSVRLSLSAGKATDIASRAEQRLSTRRLL